VTVYKFLEKKLKIKKNKKFHDLTHVLYTVLTFNFMKKIK